MHRNRLSHSGECAQICPKVEFPALTHFLEEVAEAGVETVRLDIFERVTRSELSFVYYIELLLYVTAYQPTTRLLYEYVEPIGTAASPDKQARDHPLRDTAEKRLREVEALLGGAQLAVRRGRFTASGAVTQ